MTFQTPYRAASKNNLGVIGPDSGGSPSSTAFSHRSL